MARRPNDKTIPFGPPTKTDRRRLERQARDNDDAFVRVYEQGYDDGKADARSSSSSGGRTRGGSGRARSGRRRPKRATERSLRRGARQVLSPAAADIASGMQLIGAVFGLLLLYLVLRNTTTATGILASLRRGLDWLASPNTSIPYRST